MEVTTIGGFDRLVLLIWFVLFGFLSGGEWNYYTAAGDSFGATPAFRLQGPTAFQKDDWETIAANVKSGNTDKYNIGDTKKT